MRPAGVTFLRVGGSNGWKRQTAPPNRQTASPELRRELLATVRHELGPVAVIGELSFVGLVPKTRSGKIMRRVLKAVTLDRDPGDITTIEDETSLEEARQSWRQLKEAIAQGRQ